MRVPFGRAMRFLVWMAAPLAAASAQLHPRTGAEISGRVLDTPGGRPLVLVTVAIEGTALATRSDSSGHYRLANVPPGPQVLTARRVGFAVARIALIVPASGTLVRDVEMAAVALQMNTVQVTADVVGRARGELGTASVITRDAIANQGASSLAGVLELIPGVPLKPPGLDGVQQFSLRTVPTIDGQGEQLGAFGTLIILDGVPLANAANLQTTGPRGEIVPATSSGGGVDLRRIPAAALERVEVIRGVPSARYGDLTQGAIIIDTRAGVVASELLTRYDPRTSEANISGGRALGPSQSASLTTDLARTRLAPGVRDANVWRGTVDLAYRRAFGRVAADEQNTTGSVLDTRLNVYQVYMNDPEQPAIYPGRFSSDRSGGVRFATRARVGDLAARHWDITTSVERQWQSTTNQRLLSRGAEPFTDRLTAGRSTGHFVGGSYPAYVQLDGAPWNLYARVEGVLPSVWMGGDNTLRAGAELRREWNAGPGYTFDMEFPPQATFDGVNGFDRPRRFDAIPAVATSAFYLDDKYGRVLPNGMLLDLQMGVRADVFHAGTWWASGARDVALQPRVNAQFTPRPWLRLRGGWGRTAKLPPLSQLYPPPQYYDVVNVNWYPPDSAEQLAVLTTFVKDPTNPKLGLVTGSKAEVGFEMDIGRSGAAMSLVGFHDVIDNGVGYKIEPSYVLRDHFALNGTVVGSGRPPTYITPAIATDTVPVFVDRPAHLQNVTSRGVEWTLSLPEIPRIRTRVQLQGAWITTLLSNDGLDNGPFNRVDDFQHDSLKKRLPYWIGTRDRGERALATARVVHHQPALGLVVTGTVQYYIRESMSREGATDTLAWAGYITRAGQLVPVPRDQRGDPQYRDIRMARAWYMTTAYAPGPDWLFSLQVAKTVFTDGRFSFYAFNALDRVGIPETDARAARLFPRLRFGAELSIPTAALWRTR